MRTFVTPPRPSGHITVVRLPEGAVFAATFAGESDPRDITEHIAQLLLTGALDALEERSTGRPDPDESVEAARVEYFEPVTPGLTRAPATFSWVHVPTADGGDFTPDEVVAYIARGIGIELTAGVAKEAVDVPDDARDLAE